MKEVTVGCSKRQQHNNNNNNYKKNAVVLMYTRFPLSYQNGLSYVSYDTNNLITCTSVHEVAKK